jgi:hypothetical protein
LRIAARPLSLGHSPGGAAIPARETSGFDQFLWKNAPAAVIPDCIPHAPR